MNLRVAVFFVVFQAGFVSSCDLRDDDGIEPVNEEIELQEGEKAVSGSIELPESLDPLTLKVVTTSGSYPVMSDGRFNTAASDSLRKQFLFAENEQGEVMLATMSTDDSPTLNSRSTARAILALAPWTGFVDDANLNDILDEAMQLDAYQLFEDEVSKSIEQAMPPLLNEEVIEKLNALNRQILGIEGNTGGRVLEVPEVDYLVEPEITYTNGTIIIKNDGTTTAAWGVEVLHDGMSLTDNLVLPGNSIQFPSFASLYKALKGDIKGIVLSLAAPLELPISIEGKYTVRFESPLALGPGPGSEARKFIVLNAAHTILRSLGLGAWGDLDVPECTEVIVYPLGEVILDAVEVDVNDPEQMADAAISLFKNIWEEGVQCGLGKGTIRSDSYLSKLSGFLDVYSKVETVFVLSKLFGDMIVLKDLEVCRQIINDDLYPCFSLVKDEGSDKQGAGAGESIKLLVRTELDYPGNIAAYPEGVEIAWEVKEGDGVFQSSSTFTGMDGIAEVFYQVGAAKQQLVSASIKDKTGDELEAVEYVVNSQADAPFLVGYYEVNYEWGDKLLLQVDFNYDNTFGSYNSYGRVLYYDEVNNKWFYPSFSATFLAQYEQETDQDQVVTTRIGVYIDTGGCLSEGFKLYDLDSAKQSFSGKYTDDRCYFEDQLDSNVTVGYLGENYI